MKTLFLILVFVFQALGCLQPVQQLVQMVLSTGLVKDPQAVFICLALSIIVFAAVIKFVPSAAGPFQKFEARLKGFRIGGASATPATELTAQIQSLAADVALIKSMLPASQATTVTPASLDAMATGQVAAAPAGTSQ